MAGEQLHGPVLERDAVVGDGAGGPVVDSLCAAG